MKYALRIMLSTMLVCWGAGCKKPQASYTPDVVVLPASSLPVDPQDPAWNQAPVHLARLLPQDLVEPRLLNPSTAELFVQAMTTGREIAFRLRWADPTSDDLPGPSRFADACAVQFPAKKESGLPDPQMGQVAKPVMITYWNAAWQAVVNGRGDSIRDLYPNASIDHYPFEAVSLEKGSPAQKELQALYSPARSLGNTSAGPRTSPVQDLLAEGPGTISVDPQGSSSGQGRRTPDGWVVIIVRKLPFEINQQTSTQVAFAVWDGARQEVGARKMRTGWTPLSIQAKP